MLDLQVRGRRARDVGVEYSRDLTARDVEATQLPRAVTATPLKRLKDRHHSLARYLAAGMPEGHAALICGYDVSRVSVLKADPSFRELLVFYSNRQAEQFDSLGDKLSTIAGESAQLLIEKLEEDPESVSVGQLIELTKLGADRTGYGPQSSATNLNVNVGVADKLGEARKRIEARKALKTIEVELD